MKNKTLGLAIVVLLFGIGMWFLFRNKSVPNSPQKVTNRVVESPDVQRADTTPPSAQMTPGQKDRLIGSSIISNFIHMSEEEKAQLLADRRKKMAEMEWEWKMPI